MTVYLTNSSGRYDITQVVDSVSISGEYRSPVRTLDFGLIKSRYDKNTFLVSIVLGDTVEVHHGDEVLFYGIITKRTKDGDGTDISYQAKDEGFRLLKNTVYAKYTNMTPQDIVRDLCNKHNFNIGYLTFHSSSISRIFLGASIYDVIISVYNLASDDKFYVCFKNNALYVLKKGEVFAGHLQYSSNLLTTSISQNINDLANKICVYDSDYNLIKTFENGTDIATFGEFSKYVRVTDNNDIAAAEKKLSSAESTIAVSNFGSTSFVTGSYVHLTDSYDITTGIFYVQADEHNFKNGIYQNKLTLSFDNTADDTEGGKDE